jgi:hypothetical protein
MISWMLSDIRVLAIRGYQAIDLAREAGWVRQTVVTVLPEGVDNALASLTLSQAEQDRPHDRKDLYVVSQGRNRP